MRSAQLKVASLFSGCGGFDLGFSMRGFHPQAAFDDNPLAVRNYAANVGENVGCFDLRDGIPNERSLHEIDALIAGPPCQGFSTAGKRLVDDERNDLLTLTATLAARLRPKVLVVENVTGALAGEHSRYWAAMNAIMRSSGYCTNTIQVQAANLGMAQLRRRIFFFAWRTKREIRFIMPTLAAGNLRSVITNSSREKNHAPQMLKAGTRDWRIARHISQGQKLSNVRGGVNAIATWDIPDVFGQVTAEERTVLELLRSLRRRQRQRERGDADPVSLHRLERALGTPFRRLVLSLISKGYLRHFGDHIDLVGTFNGKFRRLSWDKPSCTVDTRFGSAKYFLHPTQQRGFTVREAARIQGFDDSYIYHGSEQDQYRVIGNAVPPPMGALAAEYTRALLGEAS